MFSNKTLVSLEISMKYKFKDKIIIEKIKYTKQI